MKSNMLSVLAVMIGIIALIWSAYLHFGRSNLSLDQLTVGVLSADQITAGEVSANQLTSSELLSELIVLKSDGQELALLSKSSVTGGGALALLNAKGKQVIIASDGALALHGGDPEIQKTMINNLRGWSLVLTATPESSTIAMKGSEGYEVVIEAGKTLDDPLAIRGGRINVRVSRGSYKLDGSGIKAAPPREW